MKEYKIPESLILDIANILNRLPYGQVASVANALGTVLKKQGIADEGADNDSDNR